MKFFKVCLISAALSASASTSISVNAGAVVGATEFTQIANQIQLGLSYVEQARSLEEQVSQYKNMVDRWKNMELNTLLDPDKFFEDIYGDMQELGQILQEGRNLAYSTGNIDAAFRAKHKDFDEWASKNVEDYNPELLSELSRNWNQDSEDTIRAALKHTKFQYDDLATERAAVAALKEQTDTVEGRMQALQAISSIGLQQLQQTQKVQAAINNMTAMQANFYAQENERQAVLDAFKKKRDEATRAPERQTNINNGKEFEGFEYDRS